MPSLQDFTESRYLTKGDVTPPILVTIDRFTREELESDKGKEQKWVVHFKEEDVKPLVCNKTNAAIIADLFGIAENEDLSNARGNQIVVYVNPDVWMSGKKTGGIRVRAPKNQAPAKQPAQNGPQQAFQTDASAAIDEDVHF